MTSRTSSLAFAADFWSERYIRQIKYIFCAAFVDFVSIDVTVVSSLKGFKSRFILSFTHFKEFKNAKIIYSLWQKLEHVFLVKLKVCELGLRV